MKRLFPIVSLLPFVGLVVVSSPGCAESDDCMTRGDCPSSQGGAGADGGQGGMPGGGMGGAAEGGSANGGSGEGGQGGGPVGTCVPWDNAEGVGVPDGCGRFVGSSGGAASNGSRSDPYRTLGEALAGASSGDSVYVCNETFDESVTVPNGVTIFGGLDCVAGWSYADGARSQINGAADDVAVRLREGDDVTRLYDLHVTAANASLPGGSSVGIVAFGGAPELERIDVVAGNGQNGAHGTTPTTSVGPTDPSDPTIAGKEPSVLIPLAQCAAANTVYVGGGGTENPMCAQTRGGNGGRGEVPAQGISPTSGDFGVPLVIGGGGEGGQVGSTTSCGGLGFNAIGRAGRDGNGGSAGENASGLGTITVTGWIGVDGEAGSVGFPGQGGGGGGGRRSSLCGGGGGGGGAGGCGGNGALPGKSGGGSFAVIVLQGSIKIVGGSLSAGAGAKGGDGAPGQDGAVGGVGGAGAPNGCGGGSGGEGGRGGWSGAGLGGHSVGIAYGFGVDVQVDANTTTVLGVPGQGGMGESSAADPGEASAIIQISMPQ